ncbi:hemolysin XhlA family protein [Phaeobacter sp. JH20_02]|uniref:pseudouridine synthase n=1 Tax=unclassified Phaeobacter TaxID=2621772 RepID=UPI003A83CF2D
MTEDEWRRVIERRLQALEMSNAVDEVHRTNVEKRLDSIEDILRWLVRLVVGAMIMGAIAYALKGGFSID